MIAVAAILNAKILVVDDKDANVRLLEGILRIAGYKSVHSTTNSHEVCDLHRTNRYDLILLDLQMPGMDGFEVIEGLKELDPGGYLPVLVITAQPDHKLRALEAGARDFVSKPFDLGELRARVNNLLEVRLYSEKLAETVKELEATRESLRIQTLKELTLARQTQESLLPPVIPVFDNFEIQAFNQPTHYVGGDFYDFLELNSDQWMGVLADVSGKGIPAALLSALVLGALNSEFRSGAPPWEVMHRVNRLLCEKSMAAQFVTVFQFTLNARGMGEFISAAHNAAYLYRAATRQIEELTSVSHFLGMFPAAVWQPRLFSMSVGDTLVVYSDGLTDAENNQGEGFGESRLMEVIRRSAPNRTVKEGLLRELEAFTGNTPQNDDITFLTVRKTD
jgi:serine phosphatase RsbU (regulator of sigma subunit)